MIWNEKYECMGREELEKLQLERLQRVISRVYNILPFYRERFQEKGVSPEDLKSLADLAKLPFISKFDLRQGYAFGFFTVPSREILEVHSSSGTTGKPVVDGYTRGDLEIWSEVMARALFCAGATKRYYPQCLWIWSIYRWSGSSLRCPPNRSQDYSCFRRTNSASGDDYAGFWFNSFNLYSFLCSSYC